MERYPGGYRPKIGWVAARHQRVQAWNGLLPEKMTSRVRLGKVWERLAQVQEKPL